MRNRFCKISMQALIRKIRVLMHLPPADRMRLLGTLGLMAIVRVALWILPFRWMKRVVEGCGAMHLLEKRLTDRQVAWSILLASRNIPHATCLTQALTAQMLLKWAGLDGTLYIGVRRENRFEAHAWVECAGRVLVGGMDDLGGFTRLLAVGGARI